MKYKHKDELLERMEVIDKCHEVLDYEIGWLQHGQIELEEEYSILEDRLVVFEEEEDALALLNMNN
tara:strand:+ start:1317 stop:1514 length:198 start_codon:yes stop_codon:yes gene_type:complete